MLNDVAPSPSKACCLLACCSSATRAACALSCIAELWQKSLSREWCNAAHIAIGGKVETPFCKAALLGNAALQCPPCAGTASRARRLSSSARTTLLTT